MKRRSKESVNNLVNKKKKVQFSKEKQDLTQNDDIKPNPVNKITAKKGDKKVDHSKKFTKAVEHTSKKKFNNSGTKGSFNSKPNIKNSKAQGPTEKPKWSEMKKEKKELRIVRRKAKSTAEVFEVSHKAKLLSAQIQRKVVKPEFRANACKELHLLLKGQYKTIALTHDLSRVIQVLLKHASDDIKTEIIEEVLDIVIQMIQSKYAHHSIKRILKYGTDFIRHEVIKKLYGHIVNLAAHTISAPILDHAYGEFATKKEKFHMQQEFYGEIYKNMKDDSVKTLKDSYKDSPEMKAAILQSCKANIQRILDKNLHDGELLHSVLYDYIQECPAEDRVELISTLSPLIVPLSNSLPGVNTASICVWQGTNKDKKTILKVVKEHAVALSKHKTGYRLLLTIFDSVDDTVLIKKAIVSTLVNNIKDIAKDHWGVMTLHWLVKPKDSATFHPTLIKFLEEGFKSGTSKKDAELRVSELREAVIPALKKEIESDPSYWLSTKTTMLLAIAILSIESSKDILNSLAKAITQPDWKVTVDGKEYVAVEEAGMHMCLKKLASLDKDKTDGTLGEVICDHLTEETLNVWLPTNRGCFFLLKLFENNGEPVKQKLKKKLKTHMNVLKQQFSQGAKLLLQNVEAK